jgi:hypothetical protein
MSQLAHKVLKTCEAWANDSEFAGLVIVHNPFQGSPLWEYRRVTLNEFIDILNRVDIKWNLEKI